MNPFRFIENKLAYHFNKHLLIAEGTHVFGSEEKFLKWFESDIFALGGVTPKSILKKDPNKGCHELLDALARIEYGVY